MKKIKFKKGDRVMAIMENECRYGNIRDLFENLTNPIATVEFENENEENTLEKVYLLDLVKVETIEEKETAKSYEPVEKSEITLTPDEFRKTAISVLVNLTMGKTNAENDTFSVLVALHKALFFTDVSENS